MSKINTIEKAKTQLSKALEKVQYRDCKLELRDKHEDDKDKNRFKLSASSTMPDLRFIETADEFLFANEIISHNPKHLNLSRIKNGVAPLLFNHNPDALIGTVESARTKNQERLLATVRFSDEDDAQKRKRQVEEDVLKGVSIGYRVYEYRELTPNPIDNGFRTFEAIDTELFEISLVTTPADPDVGVGRSLTAIMTRDVGLSEKDANDLIKLLKLDKKTVHESGAALKPSDIKPKADHDDDDDEEIIAAFNDEDDIDGKTETAPELIDGDEEIDRPDEPESLTAGGGGDKAEYDIEVRDDGTIIMHPFNNESKQIVINQKDVTKTDKPNGDLKMTDSVDKKTSVSVTADNDAVKAERQRAADIAQMAADNKIPTEKVNEWLMSGRSADSIGREILNMDKDTTPINTAGAGSIDLGKSEQGRTFSIVLATNAMINRGHLEGFEKEMDEEITKRIGKSATGPLGFYVPTSLLGTRQLVMDTPGDGPELVFEKAGDFIELLRAKTRVVQLGAKIMSGLTDKVTLPRRTSANSTSWIDEADSSGVAQTTGSFDQVTLAPKQLLSRTAVSKQLLAVANYDVEQLIRDDFARSFAVAFDLAAISGSTNGPDPEGILNATNVTNDSTAGSGSIPTYTQMITLETSVAEANADDGALAYLTTPGVYGQLQATESFTNTARTIIMDGEVNGFPIARSSNVPNDGVLDGLDVGNAVIFGDWSQLILAEWGALEILVDPFALKHRGLIEYNAIMLADVAIRHPESFAFNFGARVTAQ